MITFTPTNVASKSLPAPRRFLLCLLLTALCVTMTMGTADDALAALRSKIEDACKEGNPDDLRKLINQASDVNMDVCTMVCTALTYAARSEAAGSLACMELLLLRIEAALAGAYVNDAMVTFFLAEARDTALWKVARRCLHSCWRESYNIDHAITLETDGTNDNKTQYTKKAQLLIENGANPDSMHGTTNARHLAPDVIQSIQDNRIRDHLCLNAFLKGLITTNWLVGDEDAAEHKGHTCSCGEAKLQKSQWPRMGCDVCNQEISMPCSDCAGTGNLSKVRRPTLPCDKDAKDFCISCDGYGADGTMMFACWDCNWGMCPTCTNCALCPGCEGKSLRQADAIDSAAGHPREIAELIATFLPCEVCDDKGCCGARKRLSYKYGADLKDLEQIGAKQASAAVMPTSTTVWPLKDQDDLSPKQKETLQKLSTMTADVENIKAKRI